jgi:hypothetical protein
MARVIQWHSARRVGRGRAGRRCLTKERVQYHRGAVNDYVARGRGLSEVPAPVVGCGRGKVGLRCRWERHALARGGDDVLWLALARVSTGHDRHSQRSDGSKKSNEELEERHLRQGGDMVVVLGNQEPASGCWVCLKERG